MNRRNRRKFLRGAVKGNQEEIAKVLEEEVTTRMDKFIDCFYQAMRQNRIGEERARKILQDTCEIIESNSCQPHNNVV